jgi:hypothetical protein
LRPRYGVEGSYTTTGTIDLVGSYTMISRSHSWQHDLVTTEQRPMTSDENRFELRLHRFTDHNYKIYSPRYSSFVGDQEEGRAITFWIGVGAKP